MLDQRITDASLRQQTVDPLSVEALKDVTADMAQQGIHSFGDLGAELQWHEAFDDQVPVAVKRGEIGLDYVRRNAGGRRGSG